MAAAPATVNESPVNSSVFERSALTRGARFPQHHRSVSLPRPYEESDDEQIVDGCVRGDGDAFTALFDRYGALIEVAMLRESDGPSEGAPYDPAARLAAVGAHLRRHEAAALRAWSARECSLRAYLCSLARSVARRQAKATPARAQLVAFFPTPAALHVQDVEAAAHAIRVHELLDRLPPTLVALARLRLRGMDRAAIAGSVGQGQAMVVQNLEKIAMRLAELEKDPALARDAYRIVLGAADASERARAALRTEDEGAFREARNVIEATWRAVGQRVLGRIAVKSGLCLDERAVAGFVDGTMRGQQRARSEGHVGSCTRCVDEVATLAADLRTVPVLRDAQGLPASLAIAAACLSSTRFEAARRIAEQIKSDDDRTERAARDVERLAIAGSFLEGGRTRSRESSGMVMRGLPSDDEAPLVAFEALVVADAHTAYRAIDEHTARRRAVAGRLRLVAAAAGEDASGARRIAEGVLQGPRVDPGAIDDAESVLAMPDARALPREIVIERLRDVLPEVVRAAVARR